jgi:outer membrane protein assembly factor BamC
MNRRLFFTSVLTVALTACSGTQNSKQATGGFEYAKIAEHAELKIPKSLQAPKQHNDYKITSHIAKGPIGEKIDVRAPSLVLPIAAGTRVEIKEPGTKIWFDQVLEKEPLLPFIVNAIEQELKANNSKLISKDEANHVYQSDWIIKTKEEGFWIWKSEVFVNKVKFSFTLETKPHGRSVAVITKLTDFDGNGAELDPIDKQRAEVNMLNAVVGQVDYQYRLHQREKRILRASQKLVSLSKNAKDEPAYLVEMDMDALWSNLPVFFDRYGFTITDLNESKKIYFVDYVQPDNGFWSAMWGDDQPVLDMPNGKYQFKLSAKNESTWVTLKNEQGEPLSTDTLTHIFDAIEPGLSFRKIN